MPAQRNDFAQVEWLFLSENAVFLSLPDSAALIYLKLWTLCVHRRRDWYSRAEVKGTYLPSMMRVTPECLASSIASILASSQPSVDNGVLFSRAAGGAIIVNGVYTKHKSLRGWKRFGIAAPLKPDCGPIAPLTGIDPMTGTNPLRQTTAEQPVASLSQEQPNSHACGGCNNWTGVRGHKSGDCVVAQGDDPRKYGPNDGHDCTRWTPKKGLPNAS